MLSRERIVKLLIVLIVAGVLAFTCYQYTSLAYKLYETEEERGGKGYVSDEVWYVSSARNILNKVFDVNNLRIGDRYGASLIFKDRVNKQLIKETIENKSLEVEIVDTDYANIRAVYVESTSRDEIKTLINELEKQGVKVVDVVWGWRIPDASGINDYLNTEHPPTAKYLIALSMFYLGDQPFYWRIPSIIAGVLTVFFTFLAVNKLTNNPWLSIITALFTAVDPIMRALSSIGLLDVFVALFTVIAFYFVFSRKYYLGFFTVFIGSLFKFNALFALLPIALLIIRRDLVEKPRFTTLLYSVSKLLLLTITLFLFLQALVSIPLIMHLGVANWLNQSIFGAFKWHTSVKCEGAGCPVSSAPWDWFIGNNGFPLYYFTWKNRLVALGFWPFWTIALAYMVFAAPIYRVERRVGYAWLSLLGVFSGYVLLWLIGGRSQYSFYSVQLVPLVYIFLLVSFTYAVSVRERLAWIVHIWIKLITIGWGALLKLLLVDRENFK